MISDTYAAQLQSYIDDVLDGKIVVSKAVRAAVERHVRDLSRQSTADFPYHFDANLAAKTCRFFPTVLRHSIGRYAGLPFELSNFQVFCKSLIFGWLRDCDDTRRFRKNYRSYARKNGKSTDIAGEAIYLAGFDRNPIRGIVEPVSQVVLAATKRDQVDKVLFAEAKRMREKSPAIAKRSEFVRKEIRFFGNDGEIITTGSDKPYDGLNPHNVNLDELHAWREHHRPFYDTMMTGSGFRDQPLISMITTAGDDQAHLWEEVYEYASGVALGTIQDEAFFSFIAEIDENDDPLDEANWIKANPNLGISISIDYLRQMAIEAKQSPINLNRFTRYHCNRKVTSIEKAFDMAKWDACAGELSDWKTADAIGAGVDLGGRDDLAAFALVARFRVGTKDDRPVYRYEARAFSYIGYDTKRDLAKQPFFTWIYDGLLKKTPYPIADLRDDLVEKCKVFGVKTIAHDPAGAATIAEELTQAGLEPVRMAQTHALFNEPIRDLIAAINEGRFRHDGNPMLRWAINNAVIYRDRKDLWMFDKKSSSEKIDPAVATVMAFRICSIAPARATGSLYLV